MAPVNPYLSIVVTSRNDGHGGDLLRRMQIFVDGFVAQCQRHDLPAELIFVEWNPPADRPRLKEALQWPQPLAPCAVRIIEVPPERHGRLRHAYVLPLFQMIAKNVGIRRARGQFVLATNIDILFNDELMAWIAKRELDPARMYRIDRHDADRDVPLEKDVAEQLAYCASHLVRVNTREGTFKLNPDGTPWRPPVSEERDEIEIALGAGWLPIGGSARDHWAAAEAEFFVAGDAHGAGLLVADLEPGDGCRASLQNLTLVDAQGDVVARGPLNGPQSLCMRLNLDASGSQRFVLRTAAEGMSEAGLARALRVRQLRVKRNTGAFAWGYAPEESLNLRSLPSGPYYLLRAARRIYNRASHYLPLALRKLIERRPLLRPVKSLERLHTNGCGDFTLLARERWFDLRGYPEFELFSFHIDSVFCFAAHFGGVRELVLTDPMRIYHIEHGAGWTPEGEDDLFKRLERKGLPSLMHGEMMAWAEQMQRLHAPMIFNHDDWGFAGEDLQETLPAD
ncbi:MAG: hypothetical protein MUF51_03755 [Vicinamibacteria bacterium]|nr:hypothetical protein [Vicinamibacteria bacterium]